MINVSHNILVFENLQVELESDRIIRKLKATLHATIQFCCPTTGNIFKTFLLRSTATSTSRIEAERSCIVNFINGHIEVYDQRYFLTQADCYTNHKTVNAVDYSNFQEPYLSLFRDLFDTSQTDLTKYGKLPASVMQFQES